MSKERCVFSHNFEKNGEVAFTGQGFIVRFEVFVCKKCNLSEFFFIRADPMKKLPKKSKKDVTEWGYG